MNVHKSARLTPAGRALLARRVIDDGWRRKDAALAHGVSVRTVDKWVARYRAEGVAGLVDRSSRPHHMPRLTPSTKAEGVIALRHARRTGEAISKALKVGRATVFRILARVGLSRLRSLEPAVVVQRYEWPTPGDLLHVDVKKLGRFERVGHRITGIRAAPSMSRSRGIGWEYVHVCVDDHSRVSYVEVLEDEKGPTAAGFLERAVDHFEGLGVDVKRVLSDNGSCYRSKHWRATCERRGVVHKRTRPYTPRTNGKAERFIKTMCAEWAYARAYPTSRARRAALPTWVRRYNVRRPHGSLGGRPPISRLGAAAGTTC